MADINEIFSGFFNFQFLYPRYATKLFVDYNKKGRLARIFPIKFEKDTKKNIKYVFSGNIAYFNELIQVIGPEDAGVLTSGVRSHLKYLKHGFSSSLVLYLYYGLYERILGVGNSTNIIKKNVAKLSKTLKLWKPSYLIVQSDAMPFERQLIFAAKELGIKTVIVQHGLFSKSTPNILTEGKYADIFLAYDINQAKIVSEGSPLCNVYVSGSLRNNLIRTHVVCPNKIVFIGQPYELFLGVEKYDIYFEIVQEVANRCDALGIEFIYKPHPGEIGSQYLNSFPNQTCENINTVFEKYQYFVGLGSTSLLEASLHGKTAVQIYEPSLCPENFSLFGYSYSYDFKSLDCLLSDIWNLKPHRSIKLDEFQRNDLIHRWNEVVNFIKN